MTKLIKAYGGYGYVEPKLGMFVVRDASPQAVCIITLVDVTGVYLKVANSGSFAGFFPFEKVTSAANVLATHGPDKMPLRAPSVPLKVLPETRGLKALSVEVSPALKAERVGEDVRISFKARKVTGDTAIRISYRDLKALADNMQELLKFAAPEEITL